MIAQRRLTLALLPRRRIDHGESRKPVLLALFFRLLRTPHYWMLIKPTCHAKSSLSEYFAMLGTIPTPLLA